MYRVSKKRSDKRLRRRGQFTLFIIVGLVIFFVFAFAFYARVKIINAQLGQQANDQLKDYLANNAIDQYVTSCLDAVTDEAILVASMQGGMLDSKNKINNTDYVEYYNATLNRTFNVSIVININDNCPDNRPGDQYIVSNEAGQYPYSCANTYLKDLPEKYITYRDDVCNNNCTWNDNWIYSGFFGINNLPILCDPNGANAREVVAGRNSYGCDYYADYGISMQQLLEEKISHDIGSCVNFTEILKRTPSNITLVGEASASIKFSNKGSFSVNLEYPFTITMHNRQPVTQMVDFSIDKELPFKELYEYAYELANYDVKDAKFEVFNDKDKVISQSIRWIGTDTNLYNPNYIVDIIPGGTTNNNTNIIQVTDTNHKILGIPLTINLAVRNRRPALEYINEGYTSKYDLVTTENRTLVLSPQGYDPDDEKILTYSYDGWLESYNDVYNWGDDACKNPTSMDYILSSCTIKDLSTQPSHNWTKSKLWIDTRQNASYNTTHNDIGLHTVKITVRDRAGLDDFQDVKILVFDLPLARINGSNLYNDVDDKYASYEDMYILNGSESTVGKIASVAGVTFSTFLWNDTTEPFNITKNININRPLTRVVLIPEDTILNNIPTNIMNIKEKIFNGTDIINSGISSKKSKLHDISLTVTTDMDLTNTDKYYLNVTQCLNHSSNIPAYPYDVLPPYYITYDNLTGHLMANHTCCTNDMTYRGNNAECYRAEAYGMNRSFKDYSYHAIKETPVYTIQYDNLPVYPFDNDIYMQTFTRKCSGDRGNICNGTISETRNVVQPGCDDYNGLTANLPYTLAFSKERCVGPNITYKNINSATTTKPNPACEVYSGDTFEKRFSYSTATNICTNSSQPASMLCSNGNVFEAYDGGAHPNYRYTCDGQCLDGECAKPIQNTCKCNPACDNNMPPQCQGLAFNLNWNTNLHRQCGAGLRDYFYDICSNCALIDENSICRAAHQDGTNSDCTAAVECDGTIAGHIPTAAACLSYTSRRARCGINSCQLEADPSRNINVCTTKGRNCQGSQGCDGITKGGTSNFGPSKYCDSNCMEHDCGAYIYQGGQVCPTSCTDDNQCVSDATCQSNICVSNVLP